MAATLEIHQALGEPHRARIVELLETSAPLAAGDLAERLGLHANTVRSHLDVLERAGLVRAEREPRTRPGRPRIVYRARPRREQEHELLAGALAGSLHGLPGGAELAEASGEGWGRRLVEPLPEHAEATEEACLARVADLLEERGFAPEVREGELLMRSCPFAELAETYPDVVCALHKGLLDGALARLEAPVRIASLEPWAPCGACVARLAPVA
jgi:predicted ArsR family transcriptional regulator